MVSPAEPGVEAAAQRSARVAMALVLAASLALNLWGITWGLPSVSGWAVDELLPSGVLEAAERRFSEGWHDKYPPLHFRLLALLYEPLLPAGSQGLPPVVPTDLYYHLFLLGRAVTLLMGLGLVLLVYLCGRRVLAPGAALLAAAIVALMAPFAFYAKLANLDVPYLFWWALSLLFLLRVLDAHRLLDYLLLGATAAMAMGTKDQAFGFYLLVPPLLVWARHERDRREGRPPRWLRAALAPPLLAAGLLGAVLLLSIHGALGNPDGVRAHFALITGPASRDFQEFPNDVAGHLALLVSTVRHVVFTMGGPGFGAALVGLSLAGWRRDERLLTLLVPGLSYYMFFLSVVLYCYDRFALPLAILLAFFAGDGLHRLWSRPRCGKALTAGVLLYGLGRSLSVDVLLVNDSRYLAESWLHENAGGALVATVGPPEHLPRGEGLHSRAIGPAIARLQKVGPDFVVTNADYAARANEGSEEQAFYRGLDDGTLGYRLEWSYRFRSPLLLVRSEDLADRPGQPLRSNLDKVNPEIRIYRREPRP